MGHYVVRVAAVPEVVAQRAEARLSVTDDDGDRRVVMVRVTDGVPDADSWGAVMQHAFEQIELSCKGETWGVQLEDVAPMLVEVTADAAARLAGRSPAAAVVEVGELVGSFDV